MTVFSSCVTGLFARTAINRTERRLLIEISKSKIKPNELPHPYPPNKDDALPAIALFISDVANLFTV